MLESIFEYLRVLENIETICTSEWLRVLESILDCLRVLESDLECLRLRDNVCLRLSESA